MDVEYIYNLLVEYCDKYPDVLICGSEVMQMDTAYFDAEILIRKILDSLVP